MSLFHWIRVRVLLHVSACGIEREREQFHLAKIDMGKTKPLKNQFRYINFTCTIYEQPNIQIARAFNKLI